MPASEERSISEFPSALSILATTLLLVSTYDSGNDTYDSEKVTAVDLASAILGDFEFTQDLATNVKTIFGAINSIMVLSGTTVPSSAIGANGQLYVKYSSSGGVDTVDGLYWKINNAWVEISTGGGGGGASVTLGTTVPSDASGSNGDLYVQYDGTTYAVIEYYVKINGSWRKAPYSRVVALTQAEYDLITPDPTTLYIITDAQSSYQTKTDSNLQTTANTVVGAINEVNSALSGITLNSNPATGDYHFDLATGWSVTNFVFNRVGNRIYMQGVFVKTSAFTSYETFISLSSSSTKIISPYYETWFATMCDDGNGGNVSCERLQAVYGSLRISSSNSNHRRIFVCASWISSSDVV